VFCVDFIFNPAAELQHFNKLSNKVPNRPGARQAPSSIPYHNLWQRDENNSKSERLEAVTLN